jgi:hypothetical protein
VGGLRLAVVGMVLAVAAACGSGGEQAVRATDGPGQDSASTAGPTTSGAAAPASSDAVAATGAALEAWGRFTATGDLAEVAPYFHSGGPQFLRFQDDAAGIAARRRPPASFAVSSLENGPGGNRQQVVTGTIVVTRAGEGEKQVDWEFLLFRDPESGWQVWTVKDRSTGTSPVPT